MPFSAAGAYELNKNKTIYEEGVFTPRITNAGVVHSVQEGNYVRLGDVVKFTLTIKTSTKSTEPSANNVNLAGFPFAPSQKSLNKSLFNVKLSNMVTATNNVFGVFVTPVYLLITRDENSDNTYIGVKVSDTTDSTGIIMSGEYFI